MNDKNRKERDEGKGKKRSSIPLNIKLAILKRLDDGIGSTAVGREFQLSESTIRSAKARADKIKSSVNFSSKASRQTTRYSRNALLEKMEMELIQWINDPKRKETKITSELIRDKAVQFFNKLKDLEPSCSSSTKSKKEVKFVGSKGWLFGFLRRHGLNRTARYKAAGTTSDATSSEEDPFEMLYIKSHCDGDSISNVIPDDYYEDDDNDKDDVNDKDDNNGKDDDNVEDDDNNNEHNKKGKIEPESITADEIYEGIQLCNQLEMHFVKVDKNRARITKFQNVLRSCMFGYHDLYVKLKKRQLLQKSKANHNVVGNKKIKLESTKKWWY